MRRHDHAEARLLNKLNSDHLKLSLLCAVLVEILNLETHSMQMP